MMVDPVGDMLTRIRNAHMRNRQTVDTPASSLRANVLDVLQREGYIRGYADAPREDGKHEFRIELKYPDGKPAIREISRVSKPGRRVYTPVSDLPRVRNGLGIYVLSTSRGVMADHEAREQNVGGEILCRVF